MECVYVSLLLNICLDLYVTLHVALSCPKNQEKYSKSLDFNSVA